MHLNDKMIKARLKFLWIDPTVMSDKICIIMKRNEQERLWFLMSIVSVHGRQLLGLLLGRSKRVGGSVFGAREIKQEKSP
jgi:hypothetical protein